MALSLSPEVHDLLTLHLVPGIGPRLTAALLERFGSAGQALRASADELVEVPYIGPRLAQDLTQALRTVDVNAEVEQLERFGVRLVVRGTPEYPAVLATIPDPPYLLYVRGTITSADANAVALVGSRSCTEYGKRVAQRLATGLVRAGMTIVSGLARGIDGVAHRAALQAGGRTLAVLAGGLSRIYPPEHAGLADEVAASGALLTESCMTQEPLAGLFPVRNRIISGLCKAVVLVEAAEKSGALITATHAAEQGRSVLAVPGSVESAASGGTNELIRKGAVLCRGVDDILEEIRGVSAMVDAADASEASPAAPVEPPVPPGLDEVQRRVWDFLAGAARHHDELVLHLKLSVPAVSRILMMLEIKKVVRRLPGNRYERCS
jgi:DNA processing protein